MFCATETRYRSYRRRALRFACSTASGGGSGIHVRNRRGRLSTAAKRACWVVCRFRISFDSRSILAATNASRSDWSGGESRKSLVSTAWIYPLTDRNPRTWAVRFTTASCSSDSRSSNRSHLAIAFPPLHGTRHLAVLEASMYRTAILLLAQYLSNKNQPTYRHSLYVPLRPSLLPVLSENKIE